MPGLLSDLTGLPTSFDSGTASLLDQANIIQAFSYYHYGPNLDGVDGIEEHLTNITSAIANIESDITSIQNINTILPTQTGFAGKALVTNGTTASWGYTSYLSGINSYINATESQLYLAAANVNPSPAYYSAIEIENITTPKVMIQTGDNTNNISSAIASYHNYIEMYSQDTDSGDISIITLGEDGLLEVRGSTETAIGQAGSLTIINGASFSINGTVKELGLPVQTPSENGKYLKTNGTSSGWSTINSISGTGSQAIATNNRIAINVTNTSFPTKSSLLEVDVTSSSPYVGMATGDSSTNDQSFMDVYTNQISIAARNNTTGKIGQVNMWSDTGQVEIRGSDLTVVGQNSSPTAIYGSEFRINSVVKELGLPVQTSNAGKFLTTNGTTASWASVSNLFSRTTATVTTTNISTGATWSGTISLGYSYRILAVETSVPARVRLYDTPAHLISDDPRPIGTDPIGEHGVMMDLVTEIGNLNYNTNPAVDGYNNESPLSINIPIAITNLSGSSNAIIVTVTYIRSE